MCMNYIVSTGSVIKMNVLLPEIVDHKILQKIEKRLGESNVEMEKDIFGKLME